LPRPGGIRLSLGHPALRLAVPQVIGTPGPDAPHGRLQIRLDRPVKGRLCLTQGGITLATARVNSLPERRLSLALPSQAATGPMTLSIEELP
jgi:hypothetical protein